MAAWPLFNAIGQTASNYSPGAVFNLRPLTEFNVDQDLTVDLKDYGSYVHPLTLSQPHLKYFDLTILQMDGLLRSSQAPRRPVHKHQAL